MSQNKLEVILRQHTPLIHFQADQAGATLRASEVKPRLDKFIVNELKTINPEIYKEYKDDISKNNFPLNLENKFCSPYKLKIFNESKSKKIMCRTYINKNEQNNIKKKNKIPLSGVSYFGDNYAVKSDKIRLIFFSYDEKILNLIKAVIPYVFIYNNFGTRQNKGFGSFLPENINSREIEKILELKYPVYFKPRNNTQENPLEFIHKEYQILKSGISYPKKTSSKLMNYFKRKNVVWEKNKIICFLKENNYSLKGPKVVPPKKEHYKYVRALMGLAEHIEFLKEKPKDNKDKIVVKIKDNTMDENDFIERFYSPILFKVFNKNIYLLPELGLIEKIFNREFKFTVTEPQNRQSKEKSFFLKTPSKNEYNVIEFLSESLTSWNKVEAKI